MHFCGLFLCLSKSLSNQQRKDQRRIGTNFYGIDSIAKFAPAYRLVRVCARVTSVKFLKIKMFTQTNKTIKSNLSSVDVNSIVGTISHQIRIANMMFDKASTQNENASFL